MLKITVAALLLNAISALAMDMPSDLATAVLAFDRANFSSDIPALIRLISNDYVLVNSDASVENKQKVLADHQAIGFKVEPYVLEQRVVKVWRNGAVIGGLARINWTLDGKRQTRVVRIAYVWAKRDGNWQTTYTQVTRVPD